MQLEELEKSGCDEIVQEKVSALADRPQFDTLLSTLKEGDTLVVWELDRLGRSMLDLIRIVSEMDAKDVIFLSLTEDYSFRNEKTGCYWDEDKAQWLTE